MPKVVPLPSHESDGSTEFWPPSTPIEEYKPDDLYYHEALARQFLDQLDLGPYGTFYFHIVSRFMFVRFIRRMQEGRKLYQDSGTSISGVLHISHIGPLWPIQR